MTVPAMVVRYRLRLYLLAFVFVAGTAALLAKLWSLQIDQYDKFSRLLPGTSDVTVRVPGVRGEIRDRNGVTLVTNEANFEVVFDLRDIVEAYKEAHESVPTRSFPYKDRHGVTRQSEPVADVVEIVNASIIPGLNDLGLGVGYNARALEVHYRSNGGVVPWTYRDNLTFEEFATFAEHNLGLPGVSVTVRPKRKYLYGAMACHILGYVKKFSPDDVTAEERAEFDFYVGDDTGVAGIEMSMDRRLRGVHGTRTLLKDEKGRIVRETAYEEPARGEDVYLTIDARIQMIAERALRDGGIGRGAVVVIEPSSGDILAMASVPAFDPNKFIPSIAEADWKRYKTNKTDPLVNRALKDFPPGSTMKIPVALAGCYAGVGDKHLFCDGGQLYGNKHMKCWIASKGGSHGTLSLDEAIMRSCNDYFFQYGNIAGIRAIKTVGTLLGLGQPTGIPLEGEDPGLLPDPEWQRIHRGTGWTDAQTAMIAIGQDANEATALQMASVAATVGAHGVRHQPWLISKLVAADGREDIPARPVPVDLTREGVKPEHIELVRRGMWRVVNDAAGTARRARTEGFDTAGKTGTAQYWRGALEDNRAWFISFAPFETPRLAVCVMVENGKAGGTVGAPVAARVVDEAMAIEHGYRPALAALPEAEGDFDPVELVVYAGDSLVASFLEGEDGDTGNQVELARRPAASPRDEPSTVVAPSVRPEADAEGSAAIPRAVPVRPTTRFKPAEREARGRTLPGRRFR